MKRSMTIFAGVVGVLVGMGFAMPAVALLRLTGALPSGDVLLLLLGLTLTLCGAGAAAYGAMRARA